MVAECRHGSRGAESSHLKQNANWEQYLEISQLTASDIPPNFSQTVFLTGITY